MLYIACGHHLKNPQKRLVISEVHPLTSASLHFRKISWTHHQKKRKKSDFRKRLFVNSTLKTITEEIAELLPRFLQKLHSVNSCSDFCNFIKLICSDKFPLINILLLCSLMLYNGTAWAKHSMMAFKDDTLKFWWVIYRLFHGKTLRFL